MYCHFLALVFRVPWRCAKRLLVKAQKTPLFACYVCLNRTRLFSSCFSSKALKRRGAARNDWNLIWEICKIVYYNDHKEDISRTCCNSYILYCSLVVLLLCFLEEVPFFRCKQ